MLVLIIVLVNIAFELIELELLEVSLGIAVAKKNIKFQLFIQFQFINTEFKKSFYLILKTKLK